MMNSSAASPLCTSTKIRGPQMHQATSRVSGGGNETQPSQPMRELQTSMTRMQKHGKGPLIKITVRVYKHAAARLEKIYKDPQHYIREKPVRRAGHNAKQYKKRLINQCKLPWSPCKHQWEPHRSGFQCHTCHTRVHQALTVEIEQRLKQECDLLTHEAPETDLRQNKPVGQKITRASTIKQLLEQQQQRPRVADEHNFQETTGYLRCTKCNLSIHKRTNEENFQGFVRSRCIDEAYTKSHEGHSTHSIWQKGKGVKCLNCGTQSQEQVVLTKTLRKECQGNSQSSPTLLQIFGSQCKSTQAATGSETQPAPAKPQREAQGAEQLSPPKKLKFTSSASNAPETATSTGEGGEEESPADDPIDVDFF